MPDQITSLDIKRLLEAKYSKDILVTECKTGPTIFADGHFKLDAWRMARSWKNQCYIGFEIKVSRSDFLNDDKWRNYLPYCNAFYFVCPPGIIQIDELPPEVGLMYTSKNGKKLFIKKKSAFKDVNAEEVQPLLQYILMSRVNIRGEYIPKSKKQYWEEWLVDKQIDWNFGQEVSRNISIRVEEEIEKVRNRNSSLLHRIKLYRDFHKEFVKSGLGLNWHDKGKLMNFIRSFNKREELDGKIDDIIESLKWIKK